MKKYQIFLSKNFLFLEVKISIYLNRRVFVMILVSFEFIVCIFYLRIYFIYNWTGEKNISFSDACAPREDSDQSAHPNRLIRVITIRLKALLLLGFSQCPAMTDQTARMHKMIWVFACCTCRFGVQHDQFNTFVNLCLFFLFFDQIKTSSSKKSTWELNSWS